MSARPKLLKPLAPKPPKVERYEFAPDVAEQVQRIIAEGKAELAQQAQRIQARVDAGVSALCSLEATRLKLAGKKLKLSDDQKALEVEE